MSTCEKCGIELTEDTKICAKCDAVSTEVVIADVDSSVPHLIFEVTSEAEKGTLFTVHDGDIIGQNDTCVVALPFDKFASEIHAKVICEGDTFLIEDQGSLNGTYIRISEQTKLVPGMEILIGTTRILVKSL